MQLQGEHYSTLCVKYHEAVETAACVLHGSCMGELLQAVRLSKWSTFWQFDPQ